MTPSEKRLLPRLTPGEVQRGSMILHHNGQSTVVESVRDISNSGMSLSLNEAVAPSTRISVYYSGAQTHVEVFGRVAWCNETSLVEPGSRHPGKYLMGVELLSPTMLLAALPRQRSDIAGA